MSKETGTGITFEELFKPIYLGKLRIRNRIVMPAMDTNFGAEDGFVTEQLKGYYEARAKGGVGLVIVEFTCIDSPVGKGSPRQLCVDDDKFIPGLRELAKTIQKHGAKACLQLHHAGRIAASQYTGYQAVAPSAVPLPNGNVPRELTIQEIEDIIIRFAEGARRAQEAGFDIVEVHATHAYLLAQFLSPAFNQRTDEYGGNLKNRARILLNIMGQIKAKVGEHYPLQVRLTATEFNIDNGITLEESKQIARWLQQAGASSISVSASGRYPAHAMPWVVKGKQTPLPPMDHPPGYLIYLAEAIKGEVDIPVVAVGKITPEVGEKAIKENRVDMIAIGRALIADPELPRKIMEGRLEDIRPCIGCLECRDRILSARLIECTVNAGLGKEHEWDLERSHLQSKKRVVVIGAGPAGLEAARVHATMKHEVILFEKMPWLGGKLSIAQLPPHKAELKRLVTYFENQIANLEITLKIEHNVTLDDVLRLNPDLVIVATGTGHNTFRLPGEEALNVTYAEDVLSGTSEVGNRIVIVGGGVVGCETAEFLSGGTKNITIVEMLDIVATGMEEVHREFLLERLASKGVAIFLRTKAESVTGKGLAISSQGGKIDILPADTVIIATATQPDQSLYIALSEKMDHVELIGDCVEPRNIMAAIKEGFQTRFSS